MKCQEKSCNKVLGNEQEIIEKVVNLISTKYFFLGVFCIGSQNYNLNNKDSDFDTVAIVLPNKDNLYFGNSYIDKSTIEYEEGICKIVDIKTFYKGLMNNNLNFLELLFSQYKWINPRFAKFFAKLQEQREEIGRVNEIKLLKGCAGIINTNLQFINKLNGNEHYPLYHALRLGNFAKLYMDKNKIENCFTSIGVFTPSQLWDVKINGIENRDNNIFCMLENIVASINSYCLSIPFLQNQHIEKTIKSIFTDIMDSHFDFLKKF